MRRVLIFFSFVCMSLAMNGQAHNMPMDQILVNVKQQRLYVVTALPVHELSESTATESEMSQVVEGWFKKAVRWREIAPSAYLNIHVEYDTTHEGKTTATCYAIIQLPEGTKTLTFLPHHWFENQIYASTEGTKYSLLQRDLSGAEVREILTLSSNAHPVGLALF